MVLGIIADLSDVNVDFIYKIENVIGDSRDIYDDYYSKKNDNISDEEVDEFLKEFGLE